MATPTTLPTSFSAGAVLTAAQMNNLRGAFRILQVVTDTDTTQTVNATTTYADTNCTLTITPSSTSSKILIVTSNVCQKSSGNTGNGCHIRVLRDATEIAVQLALGFTGTAIDNVVTSSIVVLDSPATTSAITYKTQFKNNVAANQVRVQDGGSFGSITAFEVSA